MKIMVVTERAVVTRDVVRRMLDGAAAPDFEGRDLSYLLVFGVLLNSGRERNHPNYDTVRKALDDATYRLLRCPDIDYKPARL